MADCDREKLVLLITGDVDGADRERLEEHLRSCGPCREEMTRLEFAWQAVGDLAVEIPSAEVIEELKRCSVSRDGVSWAGRRLLRWAAAAAAVLIIGMGVYWFAANGTPDFNWVSFDEQLWQVEVEVEDLAYPETALEDEGLDTDPIGPAEAMIRYMEEDIDALQAEWVLLYPNSG